MEVSERSERNAARERFERHAGAVPRVDGARADGARGDSDWLDGLRKDRVFTPVGVALEDEAPDRAAEAETCRIRAADLARQAELAKTPKEREILETMAQNWADLAVHLGKPGDRPANDPAR